MATPGMRAQPEPALDPRRWKALAACLLGLFATLLDVSITNVALPSIARGTGASSTQLQWVVSGYVLAFGLVPVIGGRLGDARGQRRIFLLGITGFGVVSVVVGLAPNAGLLIGARVVQGLFGGLVNPQVSGVVQRLFPGAERGRAFGALGATVGVATALGPVVGGLLIGLGGDQLGWRLVFFLNVPVAVTTVVLGRRWLPALPGSVTGGTARSRTKALDLPGALLLGGATLGVLVTAVEYREVGRLLLVVLLPTVAFGLGFLRRERRLSRLGRGPLIDLRLFREPSYAAGVALALLFFASYSGLPLVLALYYQQGLGFSALQSGLAVTALALGSAVAAPLAGHVVVRFGRPLVLGALLLFTGAALAIDLVVRLAPTSTDPVTVSLRLAVPLLLLGLGSGAIITPNQTLTLSGVDPLRGGVAAGALQTAQRVGAAIGQAVIGSVFFAVVAGAGAAGAPGSGALASGADGRAGRYGDALSAAVLATLAFCALALALGVLDLRAARRRRAREESASVAAVQRT